MKILIIPHDRISYECAKLVEDEFFSSVMVLDYDYTNEEIKKKLEEEEHDFAFGICEEIETSQNDLQIICSSRQEIPPIIFNLLNNFESNNEIKVSNKDIISVKGNYDKTVINRRTDSSYTFSWFLDIRYGEENDKNNFIIVFNKHNLEKSKEIAKEIIKTMKEFEFNKKTTNKILANKAKKEENKSIETENSQSYNNYYRNSKGTMRK